MTSNRNEEISLLNELPYEILLEIFEYLTFESKKNLRLVSTYINDIFLHEPALKMLGIYKAKIELSSKQISVKKFISILEDISFLLQTKKIPKRVMKGLSHELNSSRRIHLNHYKEELAQKLLLFVGDAFFAMMFYIFSIKYLEQSETSNCWPSLADCNQNSTECQLYLNLFMKNIFYHDLYLGVRTGMVFKFVDRVTHILFSGPKFDAYLIPDIFIKNYEAWKKSSSTYLMSRYVNIQVPSKLELIIAPAGCLLLAALYFSNPFYKDLNECLTIENKKPLLSCDVFYLDRYHHYNSYTHASGVALGFSSLSLLVTLMIFLFQTLRKLCGSMKETYHATSSFRLFSSLFERNRQVLPSRQFSNSTHPSCSSNKRKP